MKRHFLVTGISLALLAAAHADESKVLATATVIGGKHDLKDVIVAIPMPDVKVGNRTYLETTSLHKRDEDFGMPYSYARHYLAMGRLGESNNKPEMLVYLPLLKAGEREVIEVRESLLPPGASALRRLTWEAVGKDTIELRDRSPYARNPAGESVARYTHFVFDPNATPKDKVLTNPTIKPYHHVFASDGKTLLTNGPEGKYPHHRGIFFGFNQISYDGKKADVWHCRNGESQRAGKEVTTAGDFAWHRLNIAWHGQDGGKFADEERELVFIPLMKDGLFVDFRSRLTTDIADGVKLDGDPQHAGFHFRANAAVEAVDKQTYFLRPDGKGKEGEERNWDPKTKKGPVNLPWNAMCFVLNGKRYTVVYLDHPDNPKEARQSERTYGRIGTYFEYMLTPKKPLFVRYRLWIQDGEMTVEQCEALSRAFIEPVKVEVK